MALPAVADGPPLIAGLDYSTKALDVATIRGRELVSVRNYPLGIDPSVQMAMISRAILDLQSQGVSGICMEQRFTVQGKGIKSSLAIRDVSTKVKAVADMVEMKVIFVAVRSWRAVVLGNGALKTKEAKAEAIRQALLRYGYRTDNHNAADAICLATWGASTIGLEMARRANGGRR